MIVQTIAGGLPMPVMTPPQRRWAGKLFLFPGASAGLHRHHAVQFVWAQAQPLSVALRGRSRPCTAVLIPANEPHALATQAERVALMLVERHGARGGSLHRLALRQAGRDASALLARIAFPAAGLDATAAAAWCDDVLSALGAGSPALEISPAIERGIAYVEAAQDHPARLDDAAQCARLSPTRFTHRFSAEVGIPFRRYVLWARIKRAVEAV